MSTSAGGDSSRGHSVFVVTTVTFALATVFVVSRLVSRFIIVRKRTWDDWFMIVAWFLAFGLSFAIDFGTSKGLGKRDQEIKPEWLPALRSSEYAFTILYNPALMATKTSILIFYLRMSKNTQTVLRIASYATLGLVNVAGLVLTFLNAFQCRPISAAYDARPAQGKCLNIVTLYLCSAPVNIFANLAILVLPIPVLTGMRLPQRQKTVLVLTFALGIFVTIVDVIRIYYLQKAVDNQILASDDQGLGETPNFAWNASIALMWSAVEVNVGIICACVPTLKPLIKRILPSMITDRSRNGSSAEKESMSSQVAPDMQTAPRQRIDSIGEPIQPPASAHLEQDVDNQMDMMDFLTTPETGMNRTVTARTAATENTVYFGFVNMKKPKSMLKIRGREAFKYCIMVTILFFLWGFSYGLLNTLNSTISKIAHQSTAQTLGLTTAYFGAYFFGSMTVGQWVLRHAGFKATFITGLCVYGTGTLMFWPSAVLVSYPGFIISQFVVGFGLSVLETAANPFLALCGPSQYSEYRLLLAQAVQAVGTVLSQLLAQRALFTSVVDTPNLIDAQWTYLAIALFDVMLALFFYYMPLPEATDESLQQQAEDQGVYRSQTVFSPKFPLIYVTLSLAVLSQFCYVAAQESTSVFFGALLEALSFSDSTTPALSVDEYGLVGHTLFAVGRFVFAGLTLFIKPRRLLLATLLGCLLFSIFIMAIKFSDPDTASAFVMMFFFFEGPVFPLIFAIGLRGMGKNTKIAAALLTAAASGGGIFPFVMWAVQQTQGRTVQYSYCVNTALFAFGLLFAFYLNLVPKAKQQVDRKANALGLPTAELEDSSAPETPIRRLSRRFSVIFSKIGGGGGKNSLDDPVIEHRETSVVSDMIDSPTATARLRPSTANEDGVWGSWQNEMSPRRT